MAPYFIEPLGPLLLTWFNFIPAWINDYTHYSMWDEITYPFLNLNGYFIPHFSEHVITYPGWD